jgi:hypothetical protein
LQAPPEHKKVAAMVTLNDAYAVKRRMEQSLLAIPGVRGVGLGGKLTAGRPTGEPAIIVYVGSKKPAGQVPVDQLIQAEIEGVKTDVIESAQEQLLGALEGGVGIKIEPTVSGGGQTSTGTLGCFATTTNDNPPKVVLLSNYHVLATTKLLGVGDEVRLSSSCGCCEDLIAHVSTGINDATLDAAIAELVPAQQVAGRVHGVPITGTLDITPANLGSLPQAVQDQINNHTYVVHKFGGTTDLTHGTVADIDYPSTKQHQLKVNPTGGNDFVRSGDSGSVIYNDAGQVVALLWGGATDPAPHPWYGVGNHIAEVKSRLQICITKNPPIAGYRVLEKPENVLIVERLYRDLREAGAADEAVSLYGRHKAEFRELLRNRRRFIVAWHRNHGPLLVRAVKDVAERQAGSLPAELDGQLWEEAVSGIADAILVDGSAELIGDTRRYMPLIARCGGKSYADALRLLAKTRRVGEVVS